VRTAATQYRATETSHANVFTQGQK
jgi:hypothetical protein